MMLTAIRFYWGGTISVGLSNWCQSCSGHTYIQFKFRILGIITLIKIKTMMSMRSVVSMRLLALPQWLIHQFIIAFHLLIRRLGTRCFFTAVEFFCKAIVNVLRNSIRNVINRTFSFVSLFISSVKLIQSGGPECVSDANHPSPLSFDAEYSCTRPVYALGVVYCFGV